MPQTQKAIYAARKLYAGQTRKTGEEYLVHPSRVAYTLLTMGVIDDETIATALLHDVFEDCQVTSSQIGE